MTVNGLAGATAAVSNGGKDYRLVALRYDADTIYRFIFASASDRTAALNLPFRQTNYSFRRLSDAEAAALQPRRLRTYEVQGGDSPWKNSPRLPLWAKNTQPYQ